MHRVRIQNTLLKQEERNSCITPHQKKYKQKNNNSVAEFRTNSQFVFMARAHTLLQALRLLLKVVDKRTHGCQSVRTLAITPIVSDAEAKSF